MNIPPAVTIIVPVLNEAGNIAPLVAEIRAAMAGVRASFELIFVDDGSDDGTRPALERAAEACSELRIVMHDSSCGQSAAIRTGALNARGHTLVILDGDLQNDPSDIPLLLDTLWESAPAERVGLVAGQRRRRADSVLRRASSRIANAVRSRLLGDGIRDTGCGLKAFRRDLFLLLPYFDHMHRFLPALVQREGYVVRTVDVRHRARVHGTSKYGLLDRLGAGILDLMGVAWLKRRHRAARQTVDSA